MGFRKSPEKWQVYAGMGGRFKPECPAVLFRNGWQVYTGFSTVDRIGKKRSVGIGITGAVIGYAVMPLLNRSLPLAVLSIAIPRCFFEFAAVSNFPLMSEQIPGQRGKVLSISMTAGLIGSTLAGLTGPWAYYRFGVPGLSIGSLVLAMITLLTLLFVVKEPGYER